MPEASGAWTRMAGRGVRAGRASTDSRSLLPQRFSAWRAALQQRKGRPRPEAARATDEAEQRRERGVWQMQPASQKGLVHVWAQVPWALAMRPQPHWTTRRPRMERQQRQAQQREGPEPWPSGRAKARHREMKLGHRRRQETMQQARVRLQQLQQPQPPWPSRLPPSPPTYRAVPSCHPAVLVVPPLSVLLLVLQPLPVWAYLS